jgi:hypothetical protein
VSTVAEIIDAVKSLSVEEREEFLARLSDLGFDEVWDQQITGDAHAGRLDQFWQSALADIKAERTKSLEEVLDES